MARGYIALAPLLLLAGCEVGSGIDAWEGLTQQDIDGDGDIAGDETAGGGDNRLDYPQGLDVVYDIAVGDGDTLWLWGDDFADGVTGPVLVALSRTSGAGEAPVAIVDRPADLGAESELTWDGTDLWFTSHGDVANARLYRVTTSGEVAAEIPCPFAGEGNHCAGIAWDGTRLWTAEEGGTQVAGVDPLSGGSISAFTPWGSGEVAEVVDLLSARTTLGTTTVLAVRDGTLYTLSSDTGDAAGERQVGFTHGGANRDRIWYPNDVDDVVERTNTP